MGVLASVGMAGFQNGRDQISMPNSLEGALNIVINSKKEGMEMCVP
jgi:hypothetical protein